MVATAYGRVFGAIFRVFFVLFCVVPPFSSVDIFESSTHLLLALCVVIYWGLSEKQVLEMSLQRIDVGP